MSYLVEEFPECIKQESLLAARIRDRGGFWKPEDLGEYLNAGGSIQAVRVVSINSTRSGGLIIVWEHGV